MEVPPQLIRAELVEFLPQIAHLYTELGPPRPLNKRRRVEVEEVIGPPALTPLLQDPTYLTLAHKKIRCEAEWSEKYALLGDGDVFSSEVTIKLSKGDRVLHMRTKKRNKLSDRPIGELRITDTDDVYNALAADVKVLLSAKSGSTFWYTYPTPPTLSVNIDKEQSKVFFTLEYHFQFVESLYMNHKLDVITQIQAIMEHIAVIPPELPTTVTPKLFYDSITEKTASYPKIDTPPMVPELETNLLAFQGTTVRWMLEMENMTYDDESRSVINDPVFRSDSYLEHDELVKRRLNLISTGYELIKVPLLKQELWYNKFSGNLCSKPTAVKFLKQEGPPEKGLGLLSEEMGLGKTVEVVALTLLNQRPPKQLKETTLNRHLREIPKVKTTLIVCPDSIVSQWYDELVLHAPGLTIMIYEGLGTLAGKTPTEGAEFISQYDIVITSYNVVGKEVHHALYNPGRTKRERRTVYEKLDFADAEEKGGLIEDEIRDTLKGIYEDIGAINNLTMSERVDYTSPLVLLEFWRFVLDEVQMMGATITNICTTATLIPRHHAWGISGTPIRNGMGDLHSLMSFLNVHPFSNNSKRWRQLLESPYDFIQIFQGLSWRHTKAMVKDDIDIPEQQRILLSVPFGPVEQNNYEELYRQFLNDVGLDEMGNPIHADWEPTGSINEAMRNWLTTLRRICCHASFGRDPTRTSIGFHTMDKVLQMMLESSKQEISNLEREIFVAQLEIGQTFEFMKRPEDALVEWNPIMDELVEKVQNMRRIKDQSEFNTNTFRSLLELLHRTYFFIASAHYQMYTPPLTTLVPGIEQQLLPEGLDPSLFDPNSAEIQELMKDITVSRVLTEPEMEHQVLEQKYYSAAQDLRRELLAEPIKNVNDSFSKIDHEFVLPFSEVEYWTFNSLEIQSFAIKADGLINQLNRQAEVVNKWLSELKRILATRLLDTVTDPSGDEYEGSLFNQEHVSLLLMFLQRSMRDRHVLVNGQNSGILESYERVEETGGAMFDHEYSKKLEDEYPSIMTHESLRNLVIISRSLISEHERSSEVSRLSKLVLKLKNIFDEQKRVCDTFQGKFRSYNSIYNLKVTYFRRLQELSDNVKPFDDVTHSNYRPTDALLYLRKSISDKRKQITTMTTRLRFLVSLSSTSETDDEKDKLCCICRSTITIGSITLCGHRYCKDCLDQWLKTRHTCPICTAPVKKMDIYNFTFNRDEINVTFGSEKAGEVLKQVYSNLDAESLAMLSKIPLKHDYGSKVNAIVKQVLWLKKRDPYVQVVIFSQWGQLLDIIGRSMQQNGIHFLGSKNPHSGYKNRASSSNLKNNIALFKKDPNITCFLLNAKVNASGLNLVNATHVFLCEPLVQTALELQAISRIHRIGQKKRTTVWTFIIQGSVEESIVLLSARKRLEFKEQLESEEATKNSKTLVETDGERVDDDDLWNSFFSHKIGRLV